MIEVVSRQRRKKIDCQRWQSFAKQALRAIGDDVVDVTIAFLSNRQIKELNKRFRDIDRPTDVLSFPASDNFDASVDPNLGDIAIAVELAESQALENKLEFDREIAQLILHGLLHLHGYDHETDQGEMNRLELRLRRKLGI